MSRKHYEDVAAVLSYHASNSPHTCESIATDLAETFARDNERFDTDRFIQACRPS